MKSQFKAEIIYHPKYNGPDITMRFPVLMDVPKRAPKILKALSKEWPLIEGKILRPRKVSYEALKLFHQKEYLETLASVVSIREVFNMELTHEECELIQESQRRMVGGTTLAAFLAHKERDRIMFNLGGGLHHAGSYYGAGYCLYNDIGVAIEKLREKKHDLRFAIIDLDFHQADGLFHYYLDDPKVMIFSFHGEELFQVPDREHKHSILLEYAPTSELYLKELREKLPPAIQSFDPDLVFYIAGNDVLSVDPLGTMALDEEGVLKRDQFVIHEVTNFKAGLVVTLGGGYSEKSWVCTKNMIEWFISEKVGRKKNFLIKNLRRLKRMAQTFDQKRLSETIDRKKSTMDFDFSYDDIVGDLSGRKLENYLFRELSKETIELYFENFGILKKIRKKGHRDFSFVLDSEPNGERVRLFSQHPNFSSPQLLVELVISQKNVRVSFDGKKSIPTLCIEWLYVQDPLRTFAPQIIPLPGQERPGLGISQQIQFLLEFVATRLNIEAILIHPSHYHIAILGIAGFHFIKPEIEGLFLELQSFTAEIDLPKVANYLEKNQLKLGNDIFHWPAGEDFIYPLTDELKSYLESDDYRVKVRHAQKEINKKSFFLLAPKYSK